MLLSDYILTETADLEMGPHSNAVQTLWDYIPTHALIYRHCNAAAMPSYHVMVRPQFAAGAYSLQIQNAAADILLE